MDKHYGWQSEGRGSQAPGRAQNGQRWNRDDDREMRGGSRGGDYGGWDQEDSRYGGGRWASSGGDFDREEYNEPDEDMGMRGTRAAYGSRSGSQGGGRFGGDQGRWSRGSESFRGGSAGGFANEGYRGQGNFGGNRGFSSGQGSYGQNYGNEGFSGGRGYSSQGSYGQSYGQTFGQGSYGQRSSGQGFSGEGFSQGSNQAYARGQQNWGQTFGRGYAGRGPKGYQRSDERIKEQVSDRLMDDDDVDATDITVEVRNGEVTLTGTVSSRDEKRAAEDAAESAPGVREVMNQLRIRQSGQGSQSTQHASSGSTSGTSTQTGGSRQDKTQDQSKRSTERE